MSLDPPRTHSFPKEIRCSCPRQTDGLYPLLHSRARWSPYVLRSGCSHPLIPPNLPPSPPTHLPSQSSNRVHLITPLMKPLPSFPHIPDISLLHVLQGFLIHSSFSLPPLGLGHHLKGANRESEGSGVWSEAGGQVWLHRWDPACRPMEPSWASLLPVHKSGQVRPGSL